MSLPLHYLRAKWVFTRLKGDALRRYQDRRARALVAFAARHAPFYRAHWVGHDLAEWRTLPPVDKAAMMAHFGTFNTRGVGRDEAMEVALRAERTRDFAPTVRGDLTVGLSSGTSGHRGLFLVSPEERAAWAGTALARVLPHMLPPKGYRIAFFLRSNSNLYETVGASRRVHFRWFDLMTPLDEAVAGLNAFAPHLLVGPPSLLAMLAAERERGALRIAPERLVSVAEVLEPQERARLEAAFGVPVGQVYQCTEGFLAATCPAGRLHTQEDVVALQYESADANDPARVTPVVTDLWRRAQPIVRYRLGDVLRLSGETCPCGCAWQVIAAVEGRADDVCRFVGTGGELRAFFPDTIRRLVLLADDRIRDYAAEQERPGYLRLYLDVPDGAPFDAVTAAVRASAEATVAQYGCRPLCLTIERGLPSVPPGAKRRRVRCLYTST